MCRPRSLYLFAALKVSATACVVGAIIGELPASIQDGSAAILNFNQYYASAPTRLWRRTSSRPRDRVLPRRRPGGEGGRATSAGALRVSEPQAVVRACGRDEAFGTGGVTALQDVDLGVLGPASSSP